MKRFITGGITLILLSAGIFLLIGVLNPSVTFTNEVEVDAPVEKSWTTFINPANLDQWITGFKKIEYISGIPLQEGSKWLLVVEEEGQEYEVVEELKQIVPEKLYKFQLSNDMLTNDVAVRFHSLDSKTVIRSENEVKGKSIISRAFFTIMRGKFKEKSQQDYEQLKELIESRN